MARLQIKKFDYQILDLHGKFYIVDSDSDGHKYLHKDGVIRVSTDPNAGGWFDTEAAVIDALNLYFSKQDAR